MRRLSVPVVALVLVVAACSSDGVSRPTLPNRTTVPTLEPSPTAAPEPTAAPPTEGPGATAAPETAPPTAAPTAPPTAAPTAPPVTQPPATQPPAGEVTTTVIDGGLDDGDDDGTTWWPWVLLGVVLVGGLAMVATRRRAPSWHDRTAQLLDELDRVAAHLAALPPESVRFVAANEAGALATARAALAALVAEAPDDTTRSALAGLTQPVADLHVAVGSASLVPPPAAGVVPPTPTPSVAQLATVVHTTAATVRATVVPPPTPPLA